MHRQRAYVLRGASRLRECRSQCVLDELADGATAASSGLSLDPADQRGRSIRTVVLT